VIYRDDYFRLNLFLYIKKVTKLKFVFLKNRNRFKSTGFGPIWFFRKKPVQTGLARFWIGFLVWLSFFPICSFFSVWVRFGFFGFRLIKPKRIEPVGFFKIFIVFFYNLVFSIIFFLVFFI